MINNYFLPLFKNPLVQLLCWLLCAAPLYAQDFSKDDHQVQLEKLTTTEVRSRQAKGVDTILIPIGGTEQSGPYLVLGKHNLRAQFLAEKIAQKLGNALVAPVISYVPEGEIIPPTAHMRFAGTISIPDAAFNAMLEGAARSFKQHGFRNIVFLGDHGGYQKNMSLVAQKLSKEWAKESSVHIMALSEYYRLSSAGFDALLRKQGFTQAQIGEHAGLADTALTMAVDKNAVRVQAMQLHPKPTQLDGVIGDPGSANPTQLDDLGNEGIKLIVDGSVAAIQHKK